MANFAKNAKSMTKQKRNCEMKSKFGRKSTRQSNQSMNFIKIAQWNQNARISY